MQDGTLFVSGYGGLRPNLWRWGEYIGLTFLRAGGIGLATTIQNDAQKRMGFTWWKLEAR